MQFVISLRVKQYTVNGRDQIEQNPWMKIANMKIVALNTIRSTIVSGKTGKTKTVPTIYTSWMSITFHR